jgi:hypothetical protein
MSTLSMLIVTYFIEYLGKCEFIFETILYYESGDQMGYFDAKNPAIQNLMHGHLLNAPVELW